MRIVKNGDVHVSAPVGLSKKKVLQFIDEHTEWIDRALEINEQRQRQRQAFFDQLPVRTKKEREAAARRLDAIIQPMLQSHAIEMGVNPQSVSYKPMISRWGQCNVREHTLCFSTYLLLLPQLCIEHIVVHELCHLLERGHTPRFHQLMDHYFPRWREAERLAIETQKSITI